VKALLLAVWLAAIPAAAASASGFVLSEQPAPLPPVGFTDQDGKPLNLESFKGKVVVLDYWATWCPPCRSEFPALDRLQSRLADKGVVVVAVSLDRGGRPQVDRFYEQLRVAHLAKYLDPKSEGARALGLQGLPTALVIDRQGRQVARIEGPVEWDGPDVAKALDTLLQP
jgi:thiol-disulfide isomerase/thioredoxin